MTILDNDFNNNILDDLFKTKPKKGDSISVADEIILIVDRSGSMSSIKADAEGGITEFVNEQKKIGEANLTIVEFDDRVDAVLERVDIKTAPEYKLSPRGMTSLYDAIGMTLANAESLNPTGKVIVAIVTDGGENSSREYTQEAVFNRITELKEKEWEFLFLSADQDAFGTAAGLGVGAGQTVMFAANSEGMKGAYDAVSVYTSSVRGGLNTAQASQELQNVVSSNDNLDQE